MAHTCDRQWAEIAIVEQVAQQAARIIRNDNSVRLCKPLEPGGKIGGLTNDRLFLGRSLTKQIADDDNASGDADTRLQRRRSNRAEPGDGLDQSKAGANSLFGTLLVRLRIAE